MNMIVTYLGGLANFLPNDLPFIGLILFDRLPELERL